MTVKTLALAAAIAASAFAAAVPASAETAVAESRAKIERILDRQQAAAPAKPAPEARVMAQRIDAPDSVAAAKARLFGKSYGPSDGR